MIGLALAELRADPRVWTGPLLVAAVCAVFLHIDLTFWAAARSPAGLAALAQVEASAADTVSGVVGIAVATAIPTLVALGSTGSSTVDAMSVRVARWRLAGAGPVQVCAVVVLEAGVAAVCGAVLGLGASLPVLQRGVDLIARMFGARAGDLPAAPDALTATGTVVVALAIAAIGALRPAVRAARVSPLLAVRAVEVSERSAPWGRALLAVGLAAGAVAATSGTGSVADLDGGLTQVLLTGTLVISAVVAGGPWLLPATTRVWTAAGVGWSTPWFVAREEVASRPRRSTGQMVPFIVAATVVGLFGAVLATWQDALARSGSGVELNMVDTIVLMAPAICIGITGGTAHVVMGGLTRTQAYATLRCAGATSVEVVRTAIAECLQTSGTVALVAWAVTALVGRLTADVLTSTGLAAVPQVPWAQLAAIWAVGTLCVLTGTVVPALRSARGNPRAALSGR